MSFLNSIEKKSKKFESPFAHWELNEPLTEGQVNEIVNADIANPTQYNLNYDGTRAIDGGAAEFREGIASGGEAIKFRCFVTCLLYTSPSPRDRQKSRMPSSA